MKASGTEEINTNVNNTPTTKKSKYKVNNVNFSKKGVVSDE
jgi:hypothetical protein